jgi:hypothetical protein
MEWSKNEIMKTRLERHETKEEPPSVNIDWRYANQFLYLAATHSKPRLIPLLYHTREWTLKMPSKQVLSDLVLAGPPNVMHKIMTYCILIINEVVDIHHLKLHHLTLC